MRGISQHVPPSVMQAAPAHNGSEAVAFQVTSYWKWAESGYPVIHTEIAREIAAGWASGSNGFVAFATSGTIEDDFLREIKDEINRVGANGETDTSDRERMDLVALRDYVGASEPLDLAALRDSGPLVHVLSATIVDTPEGRRHLTLGCDAQFVYGERREEYVVGNYAGVDLISERVTCQPCKTRALANRVPR